MRVLRFGTERLYAQKEDLLHEVLELEAEKRLLANGENIKYQVGVGGVAITAAATLAVTTIAISIAITITTCTTTAGNTCC